MTTLNKFLKDVIKYKSFSGHPYIGRLVLPTLKNTKKDDIIAIDRYIQLQVNNFALDFQDIQYFALHLLETYEDVRSYWQDKLNYIMVDEVQDCSKSDWELINHISEKYNNLFIVGDPDQAIYEWRGAIPKFLVDFEADKDVILAENYRSTPNILDVANSIIINNEERVKKDLYTQKPLDKNAIYYHGKSEEDEAIWIANRIKDLRKGGANYNDIAVLYRASYISRNIEQALIRKQIKYAVWGGVKFFERKEIKDSLAYLRLVSSKDNLSFQRIVNVPSRKFGEKSMKLIKNYAEQEGTNLYQTLLTHIDDKMFNKDSISNFINLIEDCTKKKDTCSVSELFDYILKKSGLWDMYRTEGDEDRIDNINELINSIRIYESIEREEDITLETYLQDIALFTNADYKDDGDTVKMMTIHQAKGLEFPYVFICGLNEGIFPSLRTIRERRKRGLEEERRLMYVAITRAEKILFLTESEGYSFSLRSDKFPSRFLIEIKESLLQVEGDFNVSMFNATKEFVKNNINWQEDESPNFNIGDHVMHRFFGEGVIIDCESDNCGISYRVRFSNGIRFIRYGHLYQKEENNTSEPHEDHMIFHEPIEDEDLYYNSDVDSTKASICEDENNEITGSTLAEEERETEEQKKIIEEDVEETIEEEKKGNKFEKQEEQSKNIKNGTHAYGNTPKYRTIIWCFLAIIFIVSLLLLCWVIFTDSVISYFSLGIFGWLMICVVIAFVLEIRKKK